MIHTIYQIPSSSFTVGNPDHAAIPSEAFVGTHTGYLPKPGDTFDRYARTWTILDSATTGNPAWTFRCRATALPLITAHNSELRSGAAD